MLHAQLGMHFVEVNERQPASRVHFAQHFVARMPRALCASHNGGGGVLQLVQVLAQRLVIVHKLCAAVRERLHNRVTLAEAGRQEAQEGRVMTCNVGVVSGSTHEKRAPKERRLLDLGLGGGISQAARMASTSDCPDTAKAAVWLRSVEVRVTVSKLLTEVLSSSRIRTLPSCRWCDVKGEWAWFVQLHVCTAE